MSLPLSHPVCSIQSSAILWYATYETDIQRKSFPYCIRKKFVSSTTGIKQPTPLFRCSVPFIDYFDRSQDLTFWDNSVYVLFLTMAFSPLEQFSPSDDNEHFVRNDIDLRTDLGLHLQNELNLCLSELRWLSI